MAKKKGSGGPEPEVLQKAYASRLLHGRHGLCPLRLYGLSHYTALARGLMFRNVTFHSQTPGMRSLAKRIRADALPAFEHGVVVDADQTQLQHLCRPRNAQRRTKPNILAEAALVTYWALKFPQRR